MLGPVLPRLSGAAGGARARTSPLDPPAIGPLMAPAVRRSISGDLATLKRLLESGGSEGRRGMRPAKRSMPAMPKPDEDTKAFFKEVVPEHPAVLVRPMFGNLAAFVNGN